VKVVGYGKKIPPKNKHQKVGEACAYLRNRVIVFRKIRSTYFLERLGG